MTTKTSWRLSRLPTPSELTELVESKIITPEEAKGILLETKTEEERTEDSLKAEIKFLKELVDKLAARSHIVEVIRATVPSYKRYPWYGPYYTWTDGGVYMTTSGTAGGTGATSITNASYLGGASGAGGISLNTVYATAESLSDLKTF